MMFKCVVLYDVYSYWLLVICTTRILKMQYKNMYLYFIHLNFLLWVYRSGHGRLLHQALHSGGHPRHIRPESGGQQTGIVCEVYTCGV